MTKQQKKLYDLFSKGWTAWAAQRCLRAHLCPPGKEKSFTRTTTCLVSTLEDMTGQGLLEHFASDLPSTDANWCAIGSRRVTWDIWLYHEGAGWWLHGDGYDEIDDAASGLAELMAENPSENVVIGAILRHGKKDFLIDGVERKDGPWWKKGGA